MAKINQTDERVEITYKDSTPVVYKTIKQASEVTGLSEKAIRNRCNSSRQGCIVKDGYLCKWINDSTFRKFSAKRSRKKGNSYELTIIKELTDLGFDGLVSSRSQSKNLDNAKIDICDTENKLDFYVQCKYTKSQPNLSQINKEVGLKDKPLAIFWKKVNGSTNKEEFVCIPKDYFYKLINNV